ncbi:hypothetical protein [Umezakia ovalisporum]|jgi:chromosome segregation ATPase|uniref:Uncharacterized protein n=2 Tax=Umezakia ovalisporum TaxID=75695 RepID=A0AA43GW90_9CYAN|nr:hypothetical protein [Umezakia ovalisporum]MBI1240212.1 hypothetical protein [Nostoc sp. RI_552]MDH6057917.1 hypothetical protein [Umezakia ovalisporum FSS-43]MDH6062872.1 hypothetical protein [Umezakia ovalisporum FSS-62]MDH6066838.1 hypothetical protein [Umezakia ovalisporum APH033B]MDH6071941.1 hypothetical protein [Umezakia ovalisporum CobakiLakeA]
MVKKYLSELIQEEAQKLITLANEAAIEVTSEEVTEQSFLATEELPSPSEKLTPLQDAMSSQKDLETTVQELKQTLEKSQNKEKVLHQQIVDLQSALDEKQLLIERLTKELHEAKQTALHLAEANSKLLEESNSPVQVKSKNSPNPAKEEKSAIKVKEKYSPVNYRKSRRIPEHLIERKREDDNFAENTWLYD